MGGRISRSPRLALAGLVSIFVALSLYTTLSGQSGRYVPDNLLEDVAAPQRYLSQQGYLWDDARGPGKPRTDFSPVTAAFQAGVAELGPRPWVVERLTHALYLSLAALGVILLMRAFRPRIGLEHAVAAFVYTFSPFTSQFLLPSGLFLYYALAPWFAWFALRGVRDGDPWRWAAGFALAVAACGATNSAGLGWALVPAALIALYFALYEGRGLGPLWGWAWRAGVLSALTSSAALVVLWFSAPDVSANLHTTELPETLSRTSTWSESWRGLGFWLTYTTTPSGGLARSPAAPYFTQPAVIAATFVAPLGALIALALGRWRHRLLFGGMLLISVLLMVGIHEVAGPSPFGRLLSFAFDESQFALGFRNTYKAGAGLMLAIGVLLGIGVAGAVRAAGQNPPADRGSRSTGLRDRRLALGVGMPVFVTIGVVVASFPFWTDRLYSADGYQRVPDYWDRTLDYLEGREQPGRVLLLPGTNLTRYRWGHAQDGFFDGIAPLSPLTNRVLPQGTAETADLVSAIDEYASSPGYVKGSLGPILARLGVRWILLQNDLDWQRLRVPRPATFSGLRADPDLHLVASFGRRGMNTTVQGDLSADLLGEPTLPPVELYEVAGKPSPRPRLVRGPPLLVSGGGESWPALASARLLGGPPVAYTGAANDQDLREMVDSGSEVVVTDGNRKRVSQAGAERPSISPTLALGEPPQDREPGDLFGDPDTQSVATYADADWISASRYGFPLNTYESASRPANAFDRVERTAWRVEGPLDPDGESLTARLRRPVTVTGISVLPQAAGPWRIRAVDVILHSEDGSETRKELRFAGGILMRAEARVEASGVTEIELRITQVDGPGPVGLAGVGIAEVGVATPDRPLDLREFVRTPDDLADRAVSDHELGARLAAHPPRYELRRVIGSTTEEETELRREITTFGDHRYRLAATARIEGRSGDSAIAGLLGTQVGAVGTSRYDGSPLRSAAFAVDDYLPTGWEPAPRKGERVDLRFPTTDVHTVEVLVVSGPLNEAARSRVRRLDVNVGKRAPAHSVLPSRRRCEDDSPVGGCLETHVIQVPPTRTGRLSVTLTGIKPVIGRLGEEQPPKVVEIRTNGRDWSGLSDPAPGGTCAPLFAVDGHPVSVRLPGEPRDVFGEELLTLQGCGPVHLGPGRHRIESLAGLSGATLMTSLVPLGEKRPPERAPEGKVELVDHSSTQLDLRVDAPKDELLIGGVPWHQGWAADGGALRRSRVPLDTFSAWSVEEPTDGPVTLRFEPQRLYELAIAVSIAAAAWCLWRVTRRRRAR